MLPAFLPPSLLSASLSVGIPFYFICCLEASDKLPLSPLMCLPLLSTNVCLTCRYSVKPTYHKNLLLLQCNMSNVL